MDKKLTDSEIVKALEVHITQDIDCEKCPYNSNDCMCSLRLQRDSLDLINRLQEENERLYGDIMTYKVRWARATTKLDTAKAEAYKEFAERLKELNKTKLILWHEDIDNLLKEMVGDLKAE